MPWFTQEGARECPEDYSFPSGQRHTILLLSLLQVYSFAGVSIVLENNTSVVRAQLRDRWAPVSLETLLQQAKLLGK